MPAIQNLSASKPSSDIPKIPPFRFRGREFKNLRISFQNLNLFFQPFLCSFKMWVLKGVSLFF